MSIIIVGAGMSGMTLAIAVSQLTKGRIPVHLVEAKAWNASNHPGFDDRSIALAHGSCQQLERIGVWQELSKCATAIKVVHVSDRGHFGSVSIKAADHYLNALGQVVELHNARVCLFRLLKELPNITLHFEVTVIRCTRNDKDVSVILNDNTRLTGKLLVAADGSHSSIGTECGITWKKYPYDQVATIANVSTTVFHGGRAFERFTNYGPLAMLPISQHRNSLVWCHSFDKKNEVISWSDDYFCEELQKSFGWRLGQIIYAGKRSVYPLILSIASRFISHRTVLVGNAAQNLHPVAGQGFNLGVRDVMSLAEILAQAWTEQKDYGSWPVLCYYQKRRKDDKETTIALTNYLIQTFTSRWTPIIFARNFGLMTMELIMPLRNILIQRALGWVAK